MLLIDTKLNSDEVLQGHMGFKRTNILLLKLGGLCLNVHLIITFKLYTLVIAIYI